MNKLPPVRTDNAQPSPHSALEGKPPYAAADCASLGVSHITASFICLLAAIAWWPIAFVFFAIVALLSGFYPVLLATPFLVILLLFVQTVLNFLGLYFGVNGMRHAVRSRYRIPMTLKAVLISVCHLGLLAGVAFAVVSYWFTAPRTTSPPPPPSARNSVHVVSPQPL